MKQTKNTIAETINFDETIGDYAGRRGKRRENLSESEMPLLFLIPLVETAWAHGAIARSEKHLIFEAAREEKIDEKHLLNETLDELLTYQPGREFFASCLELIKAELEKMIIAQREPIRARLINRCRRVAAVAGSNSPMDVSNFTSSEEREVLTRLVSELSFREEKEGQKTREQRNGRFDFSANGNWKRTLAS